MKNSLIIIGFLLITMLVVSSCQTVEQVFDPSQLRTDYGSSIDALYRVIDDTTIRLGDTMNGEEYVLAMKYAKNLQVYALDLKNVQPKNRSTSDIARFDALADSIRNIALVAEYYAQTHMHIKGMKEVRSLRGNVRVLKTYLGQPRPDEGEHFSERIEFYPEDRVRASGAQIEKK